ncbi:YjbH domain-containing protein [Thiomicrorhabdus sp. ZW0627]|uniref:YjbH domain-containing protein n=1 Tax=Thiomicrorhabdus sp. ZW0627 TaxID=3039774 RepID=UPI0024363689|nr:YjbH domain-containing protein [Thiomicrorhabdus sp. ZW0627]MDG6773595.1 YjbH domain-containing protein [Thiomicrorhabdus sp. ZW0627]
MSFKGTTGLLLVPTAQVIEYGALGYGVNNFLFPGYPKDLEAENYYVTAGVWKGFEVQVGLNESHRQGADPNRYNDFYRRDLVGNAKYSFELFSPHFKVAVGGQDIAGKVINSRRYYAVGTLANELGSISLGYARNPDSSNASHLDGVFGGVQLELLYGFAALAEYDGLYKRAGLRYRLSNLFGSHAHLNAQASLLSDAPDEDSVVGLSLVVPLGAKASEVASSMDVERPVENVSPKNVDSVPVKYKVFPEDFAKSKQDKPDLDFYRVSLEKKEDKIEKDLADEVSSNKVGMFAKADSVSIQTLVKDLEDAGLQFVAAKQDADTLYIRYQNRAFDWSEQDALAQVIALSSGYADQNKIANLQIEVWSEQNPVLKVQLSPNWALEKPANNHKSRYFEPHFEQLGLFSDRQSDWDVEKGRTEWVSVKVSPVLSNTIGSEVGVYQYSLGLNTEVSSELWKGGRISINRMDLLHNSYHYESGGFFEGYAVPSDYIQAVLQQTLVPFKGFVNTVSYHHPLKEGLNTYQLIDEWRYYGFGGRHQIYGYGAYSWSDKGAANYHDDYFYGFNGYEYFWPEQGMSLNVERGTYVNEDLTTKFTLKSYVGDSQFRASLIREDSGYEKVYVALTVPLTPRKALSLGPVTVRGEGKWRYGIQTLTDDPYDAAYNPNIGDSKYKPFGFYAAQPYEPHDSVMDSGRLTPVYLKNTKKQLKSLVKKWLK